MLSHYDVLGVEPTADAGAIRHAWRVKVRLLHPDLHRSSPADVQAEAASQTLRVNRAWETLRDPEKRRCYDDDLGRAADAPRPMNGARHTRTTGTTPAASDGVTVCCTICNTTQTVDRTAGRFDCEGCRVAWQFAKCAGCNEIAVVRERKTRWSCPSCQLEQQSSWRGGDRYIFCTRCAAGTYVAADVEQFACSHCRLEHVRCACGQYSPVWAWKWRSWRCPKCARVNPPGTRFPLDVAQVVVMVAAICLVLLGVTLMAGMAR